MNSIYYNTVFLIFFEFSINELAAPRVEMDTDDTASSTTDEYEKCTQELIDKEYDLTKGAVDAYRHGLLHISNIDPSTSHYGELYYIHVCSNSTVRSHYFDKLSDFYLVNSDVIPASSSSDSESDTASSTVVQNEDPERELKELLWDASLDEVIRELYLKYDKKNFDPESVFVEYANEVANSIVSLAPKPGKVLCSPTEFCNLLR